MKITEDFIYYLWDLSLLEKELITTDNLPIKILDKGQRNSDSGPDYFNGKIKIGDTIWVGNIEMHIAASDWNKHGHQKDLAYDNVILHVVYENDEQIKTSTGEIIPILCIKDSFDKSLFYRYKKLISGKEWVPCAGNLHKVDEIRIFSWLERLSIDRIEYKTLDFERILAAHNNHWEESLYTFLGMGLGFKTNKMAFEVLCQILPYQLIAKHVDSLFQLEALIFGQAGLLNSDIKDDYVNQLLQEYDFLRSKYKLQPMESHHWKFLRMRPVNFPTIRLAQWAQILHKSFPILNKIVEIHKLEDYKKLFHVDVSDYWLTHYTFGKQSKGRPKALGNDSIDLLMINTLVPFLFSYGKHMNKEHLKQRALLILNQLPTEKNGIINRWKDLGIIASNASQSQALLHLKQEYCNSYSCLKCGIGNVILNQK